MKFSQLALELVENCINLTVFGVYVQVVALSTAFCQLVTESVSYNTWNYSLLLFFFFSLTRSTFYL